MAAAPDHQKELADVKAMLMALDDDDDDDEIEAIAAAPAISTRFGSLARNSSGGPMKQPFGPKKSWGHLSHSPGTKSSSILRANMPSPSRNLPLQSFRNKELVKEARFNYDIEEADEDNEEGVDQMQMESESKLRSGTQGNNQASSGLRPLGASRLKQHNAHQDLSDNDDDDDDDDDSLGSNNGQSDSGSDSEEEDSQAESEGDSSQEGESGEESDEESEEDSDEEESRIKTRVIDDGADWDDEPDLSNLPQELREAYKSSNQLTKHGAQSQDLSHLPPDPHFPAGKYEFWIWRDIPKAEKPEKTLNAPRMRRAPEPDDPVYRTAAFKHPAAAQTWQEERLEEDNDLQRRGKGPIKALKRWWNRRKDPTPRELEIEPTVKLDAQDVKSMTKLNLSYQDLGCDMLQIQGLRKLLTFTKDHLVSLALVKCEIYDPVLAKLVLPNLQTLELAHNDLTGVHGLPKTKGLKTLNLAFNNIDTIKGISRYAPKLENITLVGTPLETETTLVEATRSTLHKGEKAGAARTKGRRVKQGGRLNERKTHVSVPYHAKVWRWTPKTLKTLDGRSLAWWKGERSTVVLPKGVSAHQLGTKNDPFLLMNDDIGAALASRLQSLDEAEEEEEEEEDRSDDEETDSAGGSSIMEEMGHGTPIDNE